MSVKFLRDAVRYSVISVKSWEKGTEVIVFMEQVFLATYWELEGGEGTWAEWFLFWFVLMSSSLGRVEEQS